VNQREKKLYIIVSVFLLIIAVLIWFVVLDIKNRERYLTVAFLDVGQGDSIFVEAPNGNQILIDGGRDRKILESLGQVMPFYDFHIDAVVATHPDSDHIGGLIPVFDKYIIDKYISTSVTSDTETYTVLEGAVSKEGVDILEPTLGDKIYLDTDKNIYLETLSPLGIVTDDKNDSSLVFVLVYGESEYLLTGDISKDVEIEILNREENLDIDVLKVGHHGSSTSTSVELLSATTPEISIISAGKNNRYGHPHQEVIDSLNMIGSEILQTKDLGTIITRSDGYSIWLD
jgi:beta-lactamase superfamily II metal-dependent hydrolase